MRARYRAASLLVALGVAPAPVLAQLVDHPLAPDAPTEFVIDDSLRLHTADTPYLRLHQNNSGGFPAQVWSIRANDEFFWVGDETHNFTIPLYIEAGAPATSLAVAQGTGNVGVGTVPSAALHVRRLNGTAQLLVEEATAVTASRNLLRIINRGASTFRFDNSATGQLWGFGSLGSGNFFIGSTPGQPLGMTLTPAGNMTLAGTLTQSSDRSVKRDVQDVDAAALLERVSALPVSTWSYKADNSGARHMGPMAQDFAAAFGLGADDTHVAPADLAGVALAAVQALKRALDAKDADLLELLARKDAQLRALGERLSALEGRARAAGGE